MSNVFVHLNCEMDIDESFVRVNGVLYPTNKISD